MSTLSVIGTGAERFTRHRTSPTTEATPSSVRSVGRERRHDSGVRAPARPAR